jgi:hypothetical protein
MAPPPILDRAFVEQLIAAELPEDQELEYKRDLPRPKQAKETKTDPLEEFAKDVSAMANASGGVLLFGIEEDGKTKKPTLHPITDETFDQANVRLHAQLARLIEPRLVNVRFTEIKLAEGYVMALRIPGSLGGPHWFGKVKKRFCIRQGAHVSDFTYQELRAAFDRNASAATRARQWIADRTSGIKSGKTWRPMTYGPLAIVHVVPLVSYYQEMTPIDLDQAQSLAIQMPSPWHTGHTYDINFDGLIIHGATDQGSSNQNQLGGYSQLFRDGSIEIVMRVRNRNDPNPENKVIHPAAMFWAVRDSIVQSPRVIAALGKEGPLLIGVSLINTTGYAIHDSTNYPTSQVADRDDLTVPASYIEDARNAAALEKIGKTALDMIWQGFSYDRSPFYDKDGQPKSGLVHK